MPLELTDALGDYAASAKLRDMPEAVSARMVDAFVNWVGCAIVGASSLTVETALPAFASFDPHGQHAPLGRRERLGLLQALSVDCMSSAALGFDDIHLESTLHPTGPVAAALLGVGRTRPVSGAAYLEALLIGMEVECRVGLAFASSGAGANRGWYATGMAGGIGAAAGVGRLRGFDAGQMRNAFGIASARASGNRGVHGSMTSAYVPAMAAESGYVAAEMTAAGFTCGAKALDGINGMLELIAPTPAFERALRGLGSAPEALNNTYKPYPAGFVVQPIIDACRALVHEHGLSPDDLERLDLEVPGVSVMLGSRRHPADIYEAATSICFWAAAVLLTGRAGVDEASAGMVANPRNAALRERVSITGGLALKDDQCHAVATTKDGRVIRVSIESAVGSLAKPMSSADIDAKFLANVRPAGSQAQTQQLLETCRSVASLPDVAAILDILQPVGGGR
jgi:2-methylcitrate dehydratase PrpD